MKRKYQNNILTFPSEAQVFVTLAGKILQVIFGLGHNNDQGMMHLTHFTEWLYRSGVRAVADRGYAHPNLVTPSPAEDDYWNNTQKGLRSVVETVIGFVKCFSFAAQTCRISPELQEMGLMICYHLTARYLREFPIRPLLQ